MYTAAHTAGVQEWSCIEDMDAFCQDLYFYFAMCGWHTIVCREVSMCIRLITSTTLLVTLIQFTDWSGVLECSASMCRVNVLTQKTTVILTPLFIAMILVITVVRICHTYRFIHRMNLTRRVYARMDIQDVELRITSWNSVVHRVVALAEWRQNAFACPAPEQITRIVMRRQNHLIALLGAELIPQWAISHLGRFVIDRLLLDRIKTTDRRVSFNATLLAKSSRRCGIALALLSPLILCLVITYTLVLHASEIRTRNFPSLVERSFTPGAKIKYQLLNELNHVRDARFEAAKPHANLYLDNFPTPLAQTLLSAINFVSSAFMLYLICIITANEEMLVSGHLFGLNFVWLLALATLLSGATRSTHPSPTSRTELRRALTLLSQQIRHAPASWSAVSTDAMYDIRRIYRPTISIVASEIMACITIPYFLMFQLCKEADKIARFLDANACYDPIWGSMCEFAVSTRETESSLSETMSQLAPVGPGQARGSGSDSVDDALICAFTSRAELSACQENGETDSQCSPWNSSHSLRRLGTRVTSTESLATYGTDAYLHDTPRTREVSIQT